MKKNLPTVRQFGQSSLTSSFLSKSRPPNDGTESNPSKKPISFSEFLSRKVGKTDSKSIKEKQSSFSSVGSDKKESASRKGEVGGGFVLNRSVFQRFSQPLTKEGNGVEEESQAEPNPNADENDSRKRKDPFGVSSDELRGEDEKPQAKKYLVVLGDDPKPKPKPKPKYKRRERKLQEERLKPFYNHYENGCGWWDGDREGVDNEEVGCNDVWEGMGSTTLGGLEWH